VAGAPIRIISDIHYGDRASRVRDLIQLVPLANDVDRLIVNGDMMDTRPGPYPELTTRCRSDVGDFAGLQNAPVTLLTGNHDPDISADHVTTLANGEVLVVHGDVLFDEIVPWGRDARAIRTKINAAIAASPARALGGISFAERIGIWRQVAASIPQRHQSERRALQYAWRFAVDTIVPPDRVLKILGAWRREPQLAAELAQAHFPSARYIVLGHTHRPAIRKARNGVIAINTGSFCAPFGGFAVDVFPDALRVRRIQYRRRMFHPGRLIAEFPLAKR
jgi:predicted phosphodiesterase